MPLSTPTVLNKPAISAKLVHCATDGNGVGWRCCRRISKWGDRAHRNDARASTLTASYEPLHPQSRSLNQSLQHLVPVLRTLGHATPAVLAASLPGMDAVHMRWRAFVAELRHIHPTVPLKFESTDFTVRSILNEKDPHRRNANPIDVGLSPVAVRYRRAAMTPYHSSASYRQWPSCCAWCSTLLPTPP